MVHDEREITRITQDEIYFRGRALCSLVPGTTFSNVVFLLICGREPERNEAVLFDALLTSAIDHGERAPSAHVTSAVASTRARLGASVAAGLLTIGAIHGGAAAACAELLQLGAGADGDEKERARLVLSTAAEQGIRVPGYGHRVYRSADPRVRLLMDLARTEGVYGDHCAVAEAVERALRQTRDKPLIMNVDGAHGAILSDIGWKPQQCETVFIIARTVGLCAHALRIGTDTRPLEFLTALQSSGTPPAGGEA